MLSRPPEHAADATPYYIARFDDAVDTERIERELAAKDKDGKPLIKPDEHVTARYWSGETRFDIDAPQTVGGSVVRMRDYLTGDPTVFRLRRVGGMLQRKAVAVLGAIGADQAPQSDMVPVLWELAQHGVVEVTDGFSGEPWDFQGGGSRPLTKADLQSIFEVDGRLPENLGWAVYEASAPLKDAEKKP